MTSEQPGCCWASRLGSLHSWLLCAPHRHKSCFSSPQAWSSFTLIPFSQEPRFSIAVTSVAPVASNPPAVRPSSPQHCPQPLVRRGRATSAPLGRRIDPRGAKLQCGRHRAGVPTWALEHDKKEGEGRAGQMNSCQAAWGVRGEGNINEDEDTPIHVYTSDTIQLSEV